MFLGSFFVFFVFLAFKLFLSSVKNSCFFKKTFARQAFTHFPCTLFPARPLRRHLDRYERAVKLRDNHLFPESNEKRSFAHARPLEMSGFRQRLQVGQSALFDCERLPMGQRCKPFPLPKNVSLELSLLENSMHVWKDDERFGDFLRYKEFIWMVWSSSHVRGS